MAAQGNGQADSNVKLSIATGVSLAAAVAVSFGAWRLDLLGQPLWAADALDATLASTGGPGGLCPLLYAVLSCVILAASAIWGLDSLGRTLTAKAAAEPKRLPEAWRATLEGSDFAPLAGPITGDELAIAPLALLRVLRAEIWRVFIKRVVASQTVTVALVALALAFAPDLAPSPTLGPALILRIDALAAGIVLAGGVAAALMLDRAIERFAALVTHLSAAWEESLPRPLATPPYAPATAPLPRTGESAPGPSDARIAQLANSIDRLAALVSSAATPSEAQIGQLTASVERLAAVVAGTAERQNQSLAEFARLMEGGIESLTLALDRAEAVPQSDAAAATAAMAQLTAAIEQLAQPVRDQMKVLAASDRRLITMLRRQEEVVGSLGQRWSELVAALHGMTEGLANVAVAARDEGANRLPAPALGEGSAVSELEDELQDLLDDMSDPDAAEDDPARR
jgi:hypothetical protein